MNNNSLNIKKVFSLSTIGKAMALMLLFVAGMTKSDAQGLRRVSSKAAMQPVQQKTLGRNSGSNVVQGVKVTPKNRTNSEGELGFTTYDWQSNSGAITRTIIWPDGKVNFAYTMATETIFSDRGTGIGTYDANTDEWIPCEGRVENEKTGFGSIARYGTNSIVVAAHTATECGVYLVQDKDNITPGCATLLSYLDNTYDVSWPNVMTTGPNRDIIHVIATSWNDYQPYYFRSQDGGYTWDKQNVILPYLTEEYSSEWWTSNTVYWMETTEDNCLALVVNNAWSDGMVIYSYDNGETWERKVFYHHPGIYITFDNWFFHPRWTSAQWGTNGELCVAYEFNATTGEPGSGTYYPGLGGVAFWSENLPYHGQTTPEWGVDPTNPMPPVPGQPFIMDSAYLYRDIYASWWLFSDASHEMWPEYIGYLPPLDDEGNPEDPYNASEFNIDDRSLHGMYNSGVCAFPVLCTVPGTDALVAVWSAMDENNMDGNGNYYYKLFASCSPDGGFTWTDMVQLTNDWLLSYTECVYPQAAVVNNTLVVACQMDGTTGTYVQSDDDDPTDNYYQGLAFDLEELFGVVPTDYIHITATANPAEAGYATGTGSYAPGSTCTLRATAHGGYLFTNWTQDGTVVSTEPQYSFTVTEEASFVANFIVDPVSFVVTASANPTEGGIVIGAGTYTRNTTCTLTARPNGGYFFNKWTNADGEIMSYESEFRFTVTEDASFIAHFMECPSTNMQFTTYDWQSNAGAITRTITWPDGKVSFAYTMATETSFYDRGTGISTYDPATDTWTNSGGRVENEKTGFGSIARYGQNGIVVAAHTASDTRIYIIPNKDNIEAYSVSPTAILDNTCHIKWPNVMTSGPNRNIIHVVATAYDYISIPGMEDVDQPTLYFRSQDGGQTWDKQNVVLPFMTAEYGLSWGSNCCYWMETTDDNCLALVVNNPWSDGMVIYSYDNGDTWERKVFYQHPDPFGAYDDMLVYPRWTSCQWDSQNNLQVLYEFNGTTGEPGSGSDYPGDGGVAYWSETMPYNAGGTTQSAISGNLTPGQPFVMDADYLLRDIRNSSWYYSDATHDMWPEYIGYLSPLTDQGDPENPYNNTGFNIYDRTMHGDYNSGICGFPVLCKVPGTNHLVAVWSAMDENHTDMNGYHYYKLFASYSDNGGLHWTPMIQLTKFSLYDESEFVYNQAAVVGNKLIIASQCDGQTSTYVQSEEDDPYDNRYVGFVFDLDELFGDILTQHFTVSAATNMSGAGTVAGTGEYYPNQHCTLTAIANEGFTFHYWSNEAGEIVSYNRSYGFTVTEDVTYQANFIENLGQYVSMLPENRNVILEEFTGRNCGYCPDGHRIANEIAAEYTDRVWPINIHAGGYAPTSYPNLNTTDGTTIHNGFNISGYPSGVINRSTSEAIGRYDWYDYTYYQIYEQAECNIAGAVDIDSISRIATITVEVYYTGSSNYAENYLTVAMLQDSIFGSQSDYGGYNPAQWVGDQYVHMHALRDIITENGSAWGDPIAPTTQGSFITRTFTYEIPETIGSPNGVEVDLNNIYFLAWVTESYQGTPTRPILNACKLQGVIPNPYHWEVDIHQYADNMNAIGIIQIDGVEQYTSALEIGAFCGDECRGRERAEYIPELDRYLLFLTLYGEDGDTIDFRLYDHSTDEEFDLTCNTTVTFLTNDILGTPYDPFVFDFASQYEITATVEPEETGTVTGTGTYSFGQTATLTAIANEGYRFVNWTKDSEEVSTEATYSFTVTEAAAFVAHFEVSDITQTSNFVTGWTWWSTCIDVDADVLSQLKTGLGASGQVIKSQTQSTMHLGNNWVGSLTMTNELGYMVKATSDVAVDITGPDVSPEDHPITLNPGWTWIGYPSTEPMTVAAALVNHTPQANDVIKGQNASAMYMLGQWRGSLTLTPGIGYMYKSNNNDIITLTYASPTRMTEAETDNIEVHWNANYSAYPTNMTVLAAVELDGEELNSADYELAAFANGECRGSVPMMYVEPLDRYMALLTLSGEEATSLHFGLYNTETGEEYFNADETLSFEADAVIGEVDAPFVIRFRNTTGVDGWTKSLQVYPNPVEHGQTITLGLSAEEMGEVQVEIINALGVVETVHATPLQTITAPNVAGIYTLKITVEGKGTCYRKLVVR